MYICHLDNQIHNQGGGTYYTLYVDVDVYTIQCDILYFKGYRRSVESESPNESDLRVSLFADFIRWLKG